MSESLLKLLLPTIFSFVFGILITPLITHYLYKYKAWKKKAGNFHASIGGSLTPIFNRLHKERDTNTPRMGGLVIVVSVLATALFFWLVAHSLVANPDTFDFISRNQTWIPLTVFILGAFIGFIDDFLTVQNRPDGSSAGLPLKFRLLLVTLIALGVGGWFFFKLDMSSLALPFGYTLPLGWLFIPFFVFVTVATFTGGTIDGLDGLSGGVFSIIFASFAVIAFFQNQIDIAAFCAVLAGSTLAFLWFNIPPARFYMTETGIIPLTITLAVVAFLTNQVLSLAIIAFPLYGVSLSSIIQLLSKKFRGKKVFLVAPIHHHFEALGWPAYKVTMRFWVVSMLCALAGMIVAFL